MPSLSGTKLLNVFIHSGRGLRSATGKHKFCVSFEISSRKHRTDVVEDLFGNPTFSKLFAVPLEQLPGSQCLQLLVTEKADRDVLGQISIDFSVIDDRSSDAGKPGDSSWPEPYQQPLQPHKNCSTPAGELIFDIWFSAVAESPTGNSDHNHNVDGTKVSKSGLGKLRDRFSRSASANNCKDDSVMIDDNEQQPQPEVFIRRRSTSSSFGANRRSAGESLLSLKSDNVGFMRSPKTVQQVELPTAAIPFDNASLHSAVTFTAGADEDDRVSFRSPRDSTAAEDDYSYRKRWSIEESAMHGSVFGSRRGGSGRRKISPKPTIWSISPTEGPSTGGTVLQIIGKDFGQSRDDIVSLTICGCDVLSSVEFVSSTRLTCVTKPWRTCVGPVVIETATGGWSSMGGAATGIRFTFTDVYHRRESYCENSADVHRMPSLSRGLDLDVFSPAVAASADLEESTRQAHGPPVGEVIPMRKNDDDLTDDKPPTKPPRRRIENASREDVESERMNEKRYSSVEDLEAQLFANRDEIMKLSNQNKSLAEQYQNLRCYVERLLMRALERCPDILSIDWQ